MKNMISNGKSLSGCLRLCGVDMKDEEWADAMRLENDCDCYSCGQNIPENTTVYPYQKDGYGFVWGSDGYFPNGASAMYACFDCRNMWIDPVEEEDADI